MATLNLDDVFPSAYVERRKLEYEKKSISKEITYWDFLGELSYYCGFEATRAVLDDYIDIEQAASLLKGAKRAYYATVYDNGVASLAGARGDFKKIMGYYEREMR